MSCRGTVTFAGRPARALRLHLEAMDLDAIAQSIDTAIRRLAKVRALLTGDTAPLKRGMPSSERAKWAGKDRGSTEEG